MTDANQGAKIILYWLEESRAQRILWLLEELNLSYELKTFKRGSDRLAPAELKEIHPLGKSPLLSIETPNAPKPLVLAESGLIMEYLCDHFGGDKLVPQRYAVGKEGQTGGETEEWMRYRYYMHYTEGSFMQYLVLQLVMDGIKNAPVPFFVKPLTNMVASKVEQALVTPNLTSHFKFLEDQLKTAPGGGSYLCGKELTAADIMFCFPVIAAMIKLPYLRSQYPVLAEYVDKMQELEGYKRAVAKVEEVEGSFTAYS
ncbi:glutathione S-transferase [Aspergillus clavatus NRRL 1]|uniref:Glutathione S-transferase, putative n=1 Tax=Aspergillus clavatus (strain ATCC 1007 / CBS 513.65 / DSM 816 / NCTC 3887 / NRRL 1 / QM 1276 / 107) TaxID=344612 RepID=A1CNC4_ASPCL|nr:glutathione S-transferase, putative [Aspergillus clavatus NRRL 1]EAW07145.1 glutathione S-transferase, putative [Aspergillus clavatus NRRL 1]